MPSHPIHVIHKSRRMVDVLEKRANASCSDHFYISPTIGQVVNALDPLPISWDPSCLSVPAIDIYLYSPHADLPRIHVWEGVASSRGTYNATLVPSWWNSTSSQSLQVTIVPSGEPPFLSTLPAGPVINATYTAPASGTPSPNASQLGSGITQVDDLSDNKKTPTPGGKAAAVIFTLLFFGLCIAAYIKFKRIQGKKERKRWTEAVDKRMSTISTDWKSVSVAGANAAIRNSIAVGSRSSAFSFGAIRPSSTFAVEGGDEKRPVSQMRTGVGLRNPVPSVSSTRVSRVSFAPDTRISRASTDFRPSGESRRTRAFHSSYIPPVPSLPGPADSDDSDPGSLSPRQSQGPLTLTPDDIRSRIASNKRSRSITPNEMSNAVNDIDEVLPALRMMRTGNDPSLPDDFLLKPPEAVHPNPVVTSVSPTAQHASSPVMPVIPMEPIPANVMSPDEMLRAYAERKKNLAASKRLTSSLTSSSSTGPIEYPKAVVGKRSIRASLKGAGSNTMRVFYNATKNLSPLSTSTLTSTTNSPTNTHDDSSSAYGGVTHGQAASPSESYETTENLAGMGTAKLHPFGYHPNAYIAATSYATEDDVDVAGQGAEAGAVHFGHAS